MRVITLSDLYDALGWWNLVLRHHDGQPGCVELRLRRPWRWLGQRFHLWVTKKMFALLDDNLPIAVGLCVWR